MACRFGTFCLRWSPSVAVLLLAGWTYEASQALPFLREGGIEARSGGAWTRPGVRDAREVHYRYRVRFEELVPRAVAELRPAGTWIQLEGADPDRVAFAQAERGIRLRRTLVFERIEGGTRLRVLEQPRQGHALQVIWQRHFAFGRR
jgi:hypothetical protein